MSALGSPSPLFLASAAADAAAFTLEKSVRFNSADSAYLNRTPSSAGNRKKYTWSTWVKRSSTASWILTVGTSADTESIYFNGGHLVMARYVGSFQYYVETEASFLDFSSWYHIVVAHDHSLSTSTDRIKLYVNGVRITDFKSGATFPPQNSEYETNSTENHKIGRYANAYLADVYFIDGSQLDCTSFGAFDDNGVWQAAAYSGSFGTNGFHLFDFANESTVGHDSSGNNNDFTANNISTSNGTIASPTRFDWETADSGWSLSDSNYTATNTTSGYRQVYSEALGSSTTYHFVLSEKPGDNNGGWFMSSNTSVNDTHPDELSGDVVGLRTQESGLGLNGSFATANGVSSGQNAITGFSDIRATTGVFNHSEWVINMTARKVWVRSFGSSSWIKGGDPTNSSSTPSFSLPTGTIHFGYVAYSSNETQAKFVTSVPSVALGNDISFDVPTNGDSSDDTGAGGELSSNYPTMNPLAKNSNTTLTNGNLDVSSTAVYTTLSTIAFPSTGKFYAEFTINNTASGYPFVGIGGFNDTAIFSNANPNTGAFYAQGGYVTGSVSVSSLTALSAGDIVGVAYDTSNGKVWFSINGTYVSSGDPANGNNPTTTLSANASGYCLATSTYQSGTVSLNAGQRAFNTNAPSGFKCLCTSNLPTPTIADGSTGFDVVTYTGNSTGITVSGLNMSPDLVWLKTRSGHNAKNHTLFDTVRGIYKFVSSNSTNVENNDYTTNLTAFNSDGFTLGTEPDVNGGSSRTYVGWLWDAGSSTVSNTDGTLTAQLRANPTAGFSIATVTYGSNTNETYGHGLNAAPEFVFAKSLETASSWYCYHKSLGKDKYIVLNDNAGESSLANSWGTSNPTSSVMGLRSGTSFYDGDSSVIYAFTSVSGFSAFGTYTGNGSSDGPFVFTNFRVAFMLTKRIDSTSDWLLYDSTRDPFNAADARLRPNDSGAEATADPRDFLSNGFKIRDTGGNINSSGGTYLYIAFAENPFQANGGLAR